MPWPKRQTVFAPPGVLPLDYTIARVMSNEGNNLFSVSEPAGRTLLVELPSRFRSAVWLRRGGYVLVNRAALAERENKLRGEIVEVVRDEKEWRKMPYWPKEFERRSLLDGSEDEEDSNVGKMPLDDAEDS